MSDRYEVLDPAGEESGNAPWEEEHKKGLRDAAGITEEIARLDAADAATLEALAQQEESLEGTIDDVEESLGLRIDGVDEVLNEVVHDVGVHETRLDSLDQATGNGHKGYLTRTALLADLTPADGTMAEVTHDATVEYLGTYIKIGAPGTGSWLKSADGIYADVSAIKSFIQPMIDSYSTVSIPSNSRYIPISGLVTADNQCYGALDTVTGYVIISLDPANPIINGIVNAAIGGLNLATYIGTGNHMPLIGTINQSLLGFDLVGMELTGRFPNTSNRVRAEGEPGGPLAPALLLTMADWMWLEYYGQSNSTDFGSTVPVYTSQPYDNVMFDVGVMATPTGGIKGTNPGMLSVVPLVEGSASNEGGAGGRMTPVGPTCNKLSELYSEATGNDPSGLVIFGHTAGHGSYPINSLLPSSGTGWYAEIMTAAISQAAVLATAADKTIAPVCCIWVQGEGDQATDPLEWADKLESIRLDMQTRLSAAHGAPRVLHMIVPPVSRPGTGLGGAVQGAFLAAEKYPCIHLSRPFYGYKTGDGTHLTGESKSRLAQTAARDAWALICGYRPNWIRPYSVIARGRVIQVLCDVPTLPLRIDTTDLKITQNYGFKVTDANGTPGIVPGSIVARNNWIEFTIDRDLTTNPLLRYALDYNASGPEFDSASASGNICDSTPWETRVSGVTFRDPYLMPGFEKPIRTQTLF